MQGDVERATYGTLRQTTAELYRTGGVGAFFKGYAARAAWNYSAGLLPLVPRFDLAKSDVVRRKHARVPLQRRKHARRSNAARTRAAATPQARAPLQRSAETSRVA